MPMRGREEVKERKREPLRLFFWQNSIQDFPLMIFKSLSFSTQNPAGKSQVMAFTTIASGAKDREPSLRCLSISPRPCEAMWLPRKPQGRCRARQGAGSKSWTPLETTLSSPLLCTQGTAKESDLPGLARQIGEWARAGVWAKPCPAVEAHPAWHRRPDCLHGPRRVDHSSSVFFHYFFWHLIGVDTFLSSEIQAAYSSVRLILANKEPKSLEAVAHRILFLPCKSPASGKWVF